MITQIQRFTIPAAYNLLPPALVSDRATAMLLAIGLQESAFVHRRQVKGPARGFWQFELEGVRVLMRNSRTHMLAQTVIDALCYHEADRGPAQETVAVHIALAHNDTLACCLARLTLWTVLRPLPGPDEVDDAWQQYLEAWRPGRPDRARWDPHYAEAWRRVTAATAPPETDAS